MRVAPSLLARVVNDGDADPGRGPFQQPTGFKSAEVEGSGGNGFSSFDATAGIAADHGDRIDRRAVDRDVFTFKRNGVDFRALAGIEITCF